MTRVLLGKDTATGEWFETDDAAVLTGSRAGSILVVGEDGTLTELTGTNDGEVLVWNASTESWESSSVLIDLRDLIQQIAFRLEYVRHNGGAELYAEELHNLLGQVIAA